MNSDQEATKPAKPKLKKLRLLFVLTGMTILAGISMLFGIVMAVAADLPNLEGRTEYKIARNSVLADRDGRKLAILTSNQNRVLVPYRDISPTMLSAIIAIEDERFYEHEGVDLRGTMRALYQDIVKGNRQGGSTIAQQFVKNATKTQATRTVPVKIREAALAYHLSRKWSKEKLLTEYLNAIYFGNGAYGVESAARIYFGNDVNHNGCGTTVRPCAKELKPYEAALLAGMVASPSGYDPLAHPQASLRRRNLVLKKMLDQGKLGESDYQRSTNDPLPTRAMVRPPEVKSATPGSSYFTTWVRQQVVDRYGPRQAFEGGLKIKTTLDLDLQSAAERTVSQWLPSDSGPAAALVAIDNKTGEVRAMVGGSNYEKRPFNLATQSARQPGSAFKPFVLAAALKQGISPDSTWVSGKKSFVVPGTNGKEKFLPNNYEGNYSGVTTLANATAFSDNSVFAEVGIKVGINRVRRVARRMGIRTPISKNYAITLGGLRQGVRALDMAHAYGPFATHGFHITGTLGTDHGGPVGIREVRRGKQLVDRNRVRRYRVLPIGVADTARAVLESVVNIGTGKEAALDSTAVWGKTGTTENYGDAWFVGSTEEMSVAVWVGYPDRLRPMETEWQGEPVAGGTYPAAIFHSFMVAALEIERKQLELFCEHKPKAERCKDIKDTTNEGSSEPGSSPSESTGSPQQPSQSEQQQQPTSSAPAPTPTPQPTPTPTPTPSPTPGTPETPGEPSSGGNGGGAGAPQ